VGVIPKEIWLFRIVHHQNLAHILQYGLHTANSSLANPAYIPIGDNTLIEVRNTYSVPITPPNGDLGNYIPFYFGHRSPMLYRIKTGYNGVAQYAQEDIIYLCCKLDDVVQSGAEWCFTDGHAKTSTTQFFNDLKDLDRIDWNMVYAKDWKNAEEDFDRMRRKQAEFLIKNSLNANLIQKIVLFNGKLINYIENLMQFLPLQIQISINLKDTNTDFYY
jgi:hypothetical protein